MDHHFKDLTKRYFKGCLSLDEEIELYHFLEDENLLEDFKVAGRAWYDSPAFSEATESGWEQLQSRIAIRYPDMRYAPGKRIVSVSIWRWTAVAAAILVLSIFSLRFLHPQPEKIQYFTFEAPSGSRSRVILPDSTVVWLNSSSQIRIASTFASEDREVNLQGEGYFDVTRNVDLPFVVSVGPCKVTVLGTQFNISAYDTDAWMTTTVKDGVVVVSDGRYSIQLRQGEASDYDKATGSFSKREIDPSVVNAWTENRMEFMDITLSSFAEIVSKSFNVRIVFLSDKFANEHMSISLRNNESIAEIIEAICRVLPIKAEYRDNTIYLQ